MRRIWPFAFALVACGGGEWGDDDGDDDGGPDAGTNTCEVAVTWSPLTPTAGEVIDLTATVPGTNDFLTYNWQVTHGGAVPFELAAADGSRITFTPPVDEPGPYYVDLDVDGTECAGFHAPVNVRAPDATDTTWRMRFHSPLAPPQERLVNVPSGADYDYGEISLQPGATIVGSVRDSGGTGVAAYLRLVGTDTPDLVIDGWAGASGSYSITTTLSHHDLLIVPFRDDLPAMAVRDWTPVSGDFTVTTGVAVSGTVRDPTGTGIVGALVTVTVDGVPSTVGTTTAGGAFTVRARPGSPGLVVVDVVPPAGSGLPRLESAPAVLGLGQAFSVDYAASLATRAVGGVAIEQGGAAAPNARVTFSGAIATAGTVGAGATTADASGSYAITVLANGSAVLAAATVPAVAGHATVEPATGAPGVIAVDLTTAAPATIDAPAGAALDGRIVGSDGSPVGLADLRAVPTGALADADLGQVHALAGADGTFSLPLAGGASYELIVVDRGGDHALLRTPLGVTGSTSLGDIELPDGLALRGVVRASGQSAVDTAVTIYCEACSGELRLRPAAETSTGSSGSFNATLVDPGVP